jgi:hypothetical protein
MYGNQMDHGNMHNNAPPQMMYNPNMVQGQPMMMNNNNMMQGQPMVVNNNQQMMMQGQPMMMNPQVMNPGMMMNPNCNFLKFKFSYYSNDVYEHGICT